MEGKNNYVIDTLKREHEKILGFLDELERTNKVIQKAGEWKQAIAESEKLAGIAEHLVGAEPHHQREEQVLFPEIEERGILGPPAMMRHEHEALREKKKELLSLAKSVGTSDFSLFQEDLNSLVGFIVFNLREHIAKENEILYPLAAETIKGEDVWEKMKEACDSIGYCCFTP